MAVYADRSGSMKGFLDPAYPNRNDYRSVIDGLQARLSPQRVYGFGTQVRQVPGAGLDVLGNRAFYSDANTELEQVMDTIAADSGRAWNHVIVGDGRRTDPDLAHRQFVRMRELALRWTEGGGTFLVAVSRAPFKRVEGDPSGCHAGAAGGAAADSARTCPLYAFAFAAPGDGMRIAAVLADRFEHVWAFPMATIPLGRLTLRPESGAEGVTFDPSWVPEGASAAVPKIEGETPATTPLRLRVEPADTGRQGLVAPLLAAERTRAELFSRTVTADTPAPAWRRHDGQVGPVRVTPDGRTLSVFSPGGDDCRAAAEGDPCGALYRLDLRPAGTPAWLAQFEAAEAADRERTFGLGRLFEAFIPQAASAPPLARVYLLVR
ncbi:MAG TPA: hypothetical protein VHG93_00150 [Longimicrobium sp.]|nr:hypothetical protein [Longimicrobium sp.]